MENQEAKVAALTVEELRECVVSSQCPACGDQPDYESARVDSGTTYQRADCGRCELTWWEHYEMSDVSFADPADDKKQIWRRVHEPSAALVKIAHKYRAEALEQGASVEDVAEIDAALREAQATVPKPHKDPALCLTAGACADCERAA